MRRARLRNSLIIGFLGFLLGWVLTQPFFSAWHDALSDPRPSSPPPITPTEPEAYVTYAVVWVDDWSKPQPLVDAVWLVGVPLSYASVELTGLPPEQFHGRYSLASQSLPLADIQARVRGSFGGTIAFDRADIQTLVDRLGGIYLNGQKSDGARVVDYAVAGQPGSTEDVLIRQAAVIQGVLAQAAIGSADLPLPDLLEIPKTTTDRSLLLEVVRHYYPLRLESAHFHVYARETAVAQP